MAKTYKDKIKAVDIELVVAQYFGFVKNVIVPNASWGIGVHECDLFILNPSGFGTEVEIKVTRADLKADSKKWHGHNNKKIRELYFAIPSYLEKDIEFIPEHAGILIIKRHENGRLYCTKLRSAVKKKPAYKFNDKEKFKVARLGAIRIWGLKKNLKKVLRQPRIF
jgi:hypothetical protein